MIIIGICGSSGSGKSYVCKAFEKYGIKWIDTDRVYRELTKSGTACLNELAAAFGKEILTPTGSLNRKELAVRVFEGENADENRAMLNKISHKYIRIETVRLISEYKAQGIKGVTVDAPVLFESGFDRLCDATVCVTAPYEAKLQRIVTRDNITAEKASARLSCQKTDDELRTLCTYEIDNSNGVSIEKQIESILTSLCIIN